MHAWNAATAALALLLVPAATGASAATGSGQAYAGAGPIDGSHARWEISCTIRKDKFDYVLPRAMRANGVDMWIVIDRGWGTEPMVRDFGTSTVNGHGFYIFTDRGGDRIERIVLGAETDLAKACGAYDIIGDPGQLRSIVRDRDPKRIALNYLDVPNTAEGLHIVDGLSHSDFQFLQRELGEPYASRFVPARNLIADFHGERVASEIVEFAKIADITATYEERALSNEVITPGMTTLNDVAWWLDEQRAASGLQRAWYPSVYVHLPGGDEIGNTDRVIQRGDVVQIDWGAGRNNFVTDMKRFAYVLRDGETEVPPGIRHAFAESVKVRGLIRKNVRPGRVGKAQLDDLKQLVRAAGYAYTERERAGNVAGIEVNIGMHAIGNIGHDMAASLFELFPVRSQYAVQPDSLISLEFIVFVPAPEWHGSKVPVNIEENALITARGIEWLVPPQERVRVIR